MKKTISLMLAMLFCLLLVACGTNNTAETKDTADIFWEKESVLSAERMRVMEEFSSNPQITDEFLSNMEELNGMYQELENMYYGIFFDIESGEAVDISLEDFLEIQPYWVNGWIIEPMETIQYNEHKEDSNAYWGYKTEKGWYHNYYTRYAEGVYELGDGYYASVVWFQNIESEVTDHKAYSTQRTYNVIDPTKNAYILLLEEENVWRLICITAQQ